ACAAILIRSCSNSRPSGSDRSCDASPGLLGFAVGRDQLVETLQHLDQLGGIAVAPELGAHHLADDPVIIPKVSLVARHRRLLGGGPLQFYGKYPSGVI